MPLTPKVANRKTKTLPLPRRVKATSDNKFKDVFYGHWITYTHWNDKILISHLNKTQCIFLFKHILVLHCMMINNILQICLGKSKSKVQRLLKLVGKIFFLNTMKCIRLIYQMNLIKASLEKMWLFTFTASLLGNTLHWKLAGPQNFAGLAVICGMLGKHAPERRDTPLMFYTLGISYRGISAAGKVICESTRSIVNPQCLIEIWVRANVTI